MRQFVQIIVGLVNPENRKSQKTVMLIVTVSVFILSRILYKVSGIRFEAFENTHLLHFISRDLLRDDLLRSLFYLHTQPPLFNFFIGIIVKCFPGEATEVFYWFFTAVGLLLTISLFLLMVRLGVSRSISALLTAFFVVSPACILFENILLYTYFVATFLCLAALFLHRFINNSRFVDGFIFFSLLAFVILTRSFFHPVWFILVTIPLFVFVKNLRKKVILASSIPLMIVFLLYAKNAYFWGSFSSSSWLGMSFSKMITFRLSEDERIALVEKGEISELSLLPPFKAIWFYNQYLTIPKFEKTGIPILDMEFYPNVGNNWNNLSFISISRQYMEDALYILKLYPQKYLGSVFRSFCIYFFPTSDWFHINSSIDNIGKIGPVEFFYNMFVYGQLFGYNHPEHDDNYFNRNRNIGLFLAAGFLIAVITGTSLVFRELRGKKPDLPLLVTILFFLITICYVTIVSNCLEIGENERFRFNIDPLLLVLIGITLTHGASLIHTRFNRETLSRPKRKPKG